MPTNQPCVQVSAGGNFSLCIAIDGTLWSWGRNDVGQLGIGNTTAKVTPTQVGTSNHWRSVFGNFYNSVAIKDNGELWAWGDNSLGQLGAAQPAQVKSPIQLGIGNKWVAAVAGTKLIVALQADGTLWGTGRDESGQLGRGTMSPTALTSLTQVATALPGAVWRSVSVGQDHVLAIRDDGRLYAWGNNVSGKLGVASATGAFATPTLVSNGPWRSVSAGSQHSLGLQADGTAWGWGSNVNGALGIGGFVDKNAPTQIFAGTFVQLNAGQDLSSGVLSNGQFLTWGSNANNRAGFTSSVTNLDTPSSSGYFWRSGNRERIIAAGTTHAFTQDGFATIKSWGTNNNGQLGWGTRDYPMTLPNPTPSPVSGASVVQSGALSFALGETHSLYITAQGTLRAFGSQTVGELGNGIQSSTPLYTSAFSHGGLWLKASAHYISVSFGITATGDLFGWGDNSGAQIGTGITGGPLTTPTQLITSPAKRWVAVAPSDRSTYAIASDGTLWAWGENINGELGLGTITSYEGPKQVGSANDWVAIGALANKGIGLKANGTFYQWGSGIGAPTTIVGDTGKYVSLAAGRSGVLLTSAGGAVWGWGGNGNGQLGLNNFTSQSVPTLSNFHHTQNIAPGIDFFLIDDDNAGYSAGTNAYGELGITVATADQPYPVPVSW